MVSQPVVQMYFRSHKRQCQCSETHSGRLQGGVNNKKSNIASPNDCFSAKKKQKQKFIQKTRKENLQKKRKKISKISKISKRFLFNFCHCSEIWNSIFELISASDNLHPCFSFFRIGGPCSKKIRQFLEHIQTSALSNLFPCSVRATKHSA